MSEIVMNFGEIVDLMRLPDLSFWNYMDLAARAICLLGARSKLEA